MSAPGSDGPASPKTPTDPKLASLAAGAAIKRPPPIPPPISRVGRGISSQDLKTILSSPSHHAAAAAAMAASGPTTTTPRSPATASPSTVGGAANGNGAATNGVGSKATVGSGTSTPVKAAVVIQRGTSSSSAAVKDPDSAAAKAKEKEDSKAAIAAGVDANKAPPFVKAASTAGTTTAGGVTVLSSTASSIVVSGKPNLGSSSAVAQLALAKANADKKAAAEKAAASTTATATISPPTLAVPASTSPSTSAAGTPKSVDGSKSPFASHPKLPATPAAATTAAAADKKPVTPSAFAPIKKDPTTPRGPQPLKPRGSVTGVASPSAGPRSSVTDTSSPSMGGLDDDIDVPLSLPAPPPAPARRDAIASADAADDDSPAPGVDPIDDKPLPAPPPPPPKTVGGVAVKTGAASSAASSASSPSGSSDASSPSSGHRAHMRTMSHAVGGTVSTASGKQTPSSFLGIDAAHGLDPIHTSPNTSNLGINASAAGAGAGSSSGAAASASSSSSGSGSGSGEANKKRDFSFAHNLLHQWANVNNQMTFGLYTVKRFALFLKKINAQVAANGVKMQEIMKNEKLKNERLYKDAMTKFVDMFCAMQESINSHTAQMETFAKNVQTQVADPLEAFFKEAENARTLLVKRELKATTTLMEMKKRVVKERTNCMALWEDLKLSDREKRGEELLEKTPKRAKKIQGILEVIDKKRKKCQSEFERFGKTVEEANFLQEEYFRREMPSLCNEMENMEKRRLKELEKHMAVYTILQRNLVKPLEANCTALQKAVTDAVGLQQIQHWVSGGVAKHGMPPPIVPFVYDLPCDIPDLLGEKWKTMIQSDTAKLMKDQVKVQEKKHKPIEKPDVECVKMLQICQAADPARDLQCKEGDIVVLTKRADATAAVGSAAAAVAAGGGGDYWSGKPVDLMGVCGEKVFRFKKEHCEECKLNDKIDFRFLFQLKHGLAYFTQQLEKEFSAENIHFWQAVASFRKWCAIDGNAEKKDEIQSMAKAIADQFVRTTATTQVNLRSDVMEAVLKEVDSGSANPNVFNPAQQEIFNLLERDSFPRFKSSQLFVAMMEEYGVVVTVKKPGEDEF